MPARKSDTPHLPLIKRNYKPERTQDRPLIIGVDPGLSGAVAIIEIDSLTIVDLFDIPTFKTPTKSRKSGHLSHVDIHSLAMMIEHYSPMTALAVLEEPGAMPKQGLSSTFRFGHVCGQIHGVLAGHYVPTVPVKPQAWKLALGLSADKDESRFMATDIFDGFQWLWQMKKNNDRAEAALLGYFGTKHLKGLIEFNRPPTE